MKIIKFGGSCLKNSNDFKRISDILSKDNDKKKIIVLSAFYGVTDILIKGIDKKNLNENSIKTIIEKLKRKHFKIIEKSFDNSKEQNRVKNILLPYLENLKKLFLGAIYTGEVSESLQSSIISFGERLSVVIFSEIMKDKGFNTVPYFSDKVGVIKKNGCSNCADLKKTRKNLIKFKNKISENIIPVITGYFAIDENRKISTFGRNGSDYSAAVIANALNADELEFWKDVQGFMSSDPSLVKDAVLIDELSFDEAAELSYFGAGILHPRCLEPVRHSNTNIIIKNFLNPNESGSIIKQEIQDSNKIRGVTFNGHISVLKINGSSVGYKHGIIGNIGTILSNKDINIYSIITSQTSINLIIDQKDIIKSIRLLKRIKEPAIEEILGIKDLTLIAVVGHNLAKIKSSLKKMFEILTKLSINIEMISAGASSSAYYLLIEKEAFKKSINKIHNELIISS